jgi:hypothetical protein
MGAANFTKKSAKKFELCFLECVSAVITALPMTTLHNQGGSAYDGSAYEALLMAALHYDGVAL